MAKQVKEVAIIARYAFKADPRKVCYLVRASNGKDEYMTCLFDGKACSCECKATRPCYHMKQIETIEAARKAGKTEQVEVVSARDLALAAARAASDQELARIEAETFAQIEQEMAAAPGIGKSEQALLADLPLSDDEKKYSHVARQERANRAPLNGNRGFSLMR